MKTSETAKTADENPSSLMMDLNIRSKQPETNNKRLKTKDRLKHCV
jgi:hypothetical protein